MVDYAHPESLVSTEWVAEHGNDANVRLVEVDVDTAAYDSGHIAGAVGWNWQTQLQETVSRDLVSKSGMEALLGGAGDKSLSHGLMCGLVQKSLREQRFCVFHVGEHPILSRLGIAG